MVSKGFILSSNGFPLVSKGFTFVTKEFPFVTNDFMAEEASRRDLSERTLAGVGAVYGRDSGEYEKAGGTRKSEIKRSPRKKTTA